MDRIVEGGRGTELAKTDIESAYRMVPVHPGDRPLRDSLLVFGLLKIFTAIADTLQWEFQKQGVTWVPHYLDDHITMGPHHHGTTTLGDMQTKHGSDVIILQEIGGPNSTREVCRAINSNGLPRF